MALSLNELKRRYEGGEKQMKHIRRRMKEELKRKCVHRGCYESLAFERASTQLCKKHRGIPLKKATKTNNKKRPKKIYTKAELRKTNRLKRKLYYERHGIKFDKNIRRKVELTAHAKTNGTGREYSGETLIYENYKQPLKKIPKSDGYGYYGTLAQTTDKEFVQCHICGNLFSNLSLHLRIHKMTGPGYKEKYRLSKGAALISDVQRLKKQDNAVKPWDGKLPEHLKEYNRKVQSGEIKHKFKKRGDYSLQWRNEQGLCPEQVLEKIKELAQTLGHTPSDDEFRQHYKGRYYSSIRYLHGSYLNAVKKAKLVSAKELKEPPNEQLLRELVEFKEQHNRIPMTSDFKRGLLRPRQMYFRRFGTLNNARIEAGLNAILPMPFGQIKELTADEYLDYKKKHEKVKI